MMFSLNIERTLKALLSQEDTDNDKRITIEDAGPKSFKIISNSNIVHTIEGTYHLSNLMQELIYAKNKGETVAEIPLSKIEELPATRISRIIKDYLWAGLTRTIDASGIENLILDSKNESLIAQNLRIYVPFNDTLAYNYYKTLQERLPIEVIDLPEDITPEYVKSINEQPGILSLKLIGENNECKGVPFVVPGGRFNEMYGWDSYFESVGLIVDGKVELAKGMADNFQYEIEYYGKILNANRSYYLTRTQPPFYSSLIREVYDETKDKAWLKTHLKTAIKEYETVWMRPGKRLVDTGLNRYLAEGIGVPPETEQGHFNAIIKPYAEKSGLSIDAYLIQYNSDTIKNPELDAYFVQDRSVRESGHDTSYRIEGNCTDLNLVELNAMLYKYETDFAFLIKKEFKDAFQTESKIYSSDYFSRKAERRLQLANQFLWDENKGMYFDYNFKTSAPSHFVAATTLVPMWSKMASKEQAKRLIETALPLLKHQGGIAASTEASRGPISDDRPARQWDYPNGWVPHQMMIWKGLLNYGYKYEAQELIYRWLYMITKNAVDYNGTIPEKYDVVAATHKVFAEYGNVGTDFEYLTNEGFGWMNASYQYGLSLLEDNYIKDLNHLKEPELVF